MTYTQVSSDRDDLLGQVVDEFFQSMALGEDPDLADYLRRYPEIADLLKVAIPAMQAAEAAAVRSEPLSPKQEGPPEKQLGDFRILRQIGRGGMGIVYEAEQISMRRRVALKVLPLAGLVDEQRIQRFQNEVRAVAALDHPNVVSVFMVGEERGVHYYAMQLVRGRSLAQVIDSLREVRDEGEALTGQSVTQIMMAGQQDEKGGSAGDVAITKFAEGNSNDATKPKHLETVARAEDSTIPHANRREYFRSVAALGIQAALALQHAHDQGIVHRDIKPANLLLDRHSKLYVTDFGLARIEADAGVTMTGDMVGTLRYMAPEQALAKRVVVDHRADIYSLAATLYELLTLRPAYPAVDRQQLLKQIAFEEPVRLRRVDPAIPDELETIVLKSMSKDMEDRYASAQELADDLRCFVENRPIKAKPPAVAQIVAKWVRRNPTIAWASLVTLVLVTIAFGVSTILVAKQRDVAENQLHVSTITRLAAESLALGDERPVLSVLLAVEAMKLGKQHDMGVLPISHEALLNASQRFYGGQSLAGSGLSVTSLAMSSDWLITLGDGRVHLWDLTAPRPTSASRRLGDDNDSTTTMALSRDGRWLVTGGTKLQRWDLSARNPEISPLVVDPDSTPVTALSMSSDGRWLAARTADGTVRAWDLNAASNEPRLVSRGTFEAPGVLVSPDGKWLVAVPDDQQTTIRIWRLDTKAMVAESLLLEGHQSNVGSFAVSPDGQWLATGAADERTIRIWDLKQEGPVKPRLVLSVSDHLGPNNLRFSPDSRWLFTDLGYVPRILRWDLSGADPASTVTVLPHVEWTTSLETSYDGRWLISGSHDGTVRFFEAAADDPSAASLIVHAHDAIGSVAIHPDRRWFATAGTDGTAKLWDLLGANPTSSPFVLRSQTDDVFTKTAISSTGRWIATSVKDRAIQLWDVDSKNPSQFERLLQGPKAMISSVEISSNDRWLVAGCRDGAAHVWDLTNPDIPSSWRVFGSQTSGIDGSNGRAIIGPDSRRLAIVRASNQVHVWDLNAEDVDAPARVLSVDVRTIYSMASTPNGRWIAVGGRENQSSHAVWVWDLDAEGPEATVKLQSLNTPVHSIAADANSRWLATQGSDSTTCLWDLHADEPGNSPRVLPLPTGTQESCWRIAITPNAQWLLTGRFDGTAQLWDLTHSPARSYELRGHSGVQSAAISPDGHWLAVGSRSHAFLWDLSSPDPTKTIRALKGHAEVIWSVRFSANSRWLVTDSSDGTIRRWCLDADWLLDYARDNAGRELTNEEREHYGITVKGNIWRAGGRK